MLMVMIVDLMITLVAAVIGAVRWPKANTAWRLAIVAAWVLLFGSISKFLAGVGVLPDEGWGLMIAGIPLIMVLYVCGSEFLLLLGIWKSPKA